MVCFLINGLKFPHQDRDDELIVTPSTTSPQTGVSPEDPDTSADNHTSLFPSNDLDQTTGSGMLPSLSGEEELVGGPEEVQPTAGIEPQNNTPELKESGINPESKKTQAGPSADWTIR